MLITRTLRLNAPPGEVLAAYLDPSGIAARYAAVGAEDVKILEQTRDPKSARVRVERSVEIDVPAFAKAFFKPRNTILQVDEWNDLHTDQPHCRYSVEIRGTPVKVQGTIRLEAQDSGTLETVTALIEVKIPLVGKKVEELVAEQTQHNINEEFAHLEVLYS